MKSTLAEALSARGYTALTPVQEAVTAPETLGRDMLVSAQTGSGKTLGFGLAIAPTLLEQSEHFPDAAAPLALIIAPTRELALQVKRELGWLYEKAGVAMASTVGGMDMRDERRALARGAHVVVATPGRLRDHIMRETIDLSALKAVVLDEADEMLDLGFREDLEFILEAAPEDRQTLLFSATVPPIIGRLAENYQRDALRIATTSGARQHADIDYQALRVAARDGENAIINVLRYHEAPNAIVFCNTRAMVNRLTTRLSNRGFPVVALSGELSQSERGHALQSMRDGRARVCVATDVAARGIDLPNLDLVIHAELPSNQETLLHRSGRTGRAGRKGTSALIVPPASRRKADRLLGWAKVRATWANAPSAEDVRAQDRARMLSAEDWNEPTSDADQEDLAELTARFSPEQLAAGYLRLFRAKHAAPEELSDVDAPEAPRPAFGPSRWYSLPCGRAAGAEPRRLLPLLSKLGGLGRDDVGAIRMRDDFTLIEIRESAVAGMEMALGAEMELGDLGALSPAEAPAERNKPRGPKPARGPKPHRGQDREKAPATTREGTKRDAQESNRKPTAHDKPAGKPKPSKARFDKPASKSASKPAAKAERPGKPSASKPKPSKSAKGQGGDAFPSKRGASAGKPSKTSKPNAQPDRGKGPKPPVGKPNSKKNKARRAAAAAQSKRGKG